MNEENMATREEMINEGRGRLCCLNLPSNCIHEFLKGHPWFSEGVGSYEMTNEKALQEKIKQFESENNCVVYHAIHNKFEFGECWTLLYVGNDKEEWYYDKNDLQDGYAMAYVWNVDDDLCSEFGTVGVRGVHGAVMRTA